MCPYRSTSKVFPLNSGFDYYKDGMSLFQGVGILLLKRVNITYSILFPGKVIDGNQVRGSSLLTEAYYLGEVYD